jgi:hypothetical protein
MFWFHVGLFLFMPGEEIKELGKIKGGFQNSSISKSSGDIRI